MRNQLEQEPINLMGSWLDWWVTGVPVPLPPSIVRGIPFLFPVKRLLG